MSRLGPSLVIAATLAAAGCDDRSDVASCTISGSADAGVAQTTCWELSGLTAESRHVFSDSCFVSTAQFGEDATARLAYAPCPRAGALGGCRLNASSDTTFWYYAGGQYAADDIPALCVQINATFVAP